MNAEPTASREMTPEERIARYLDEIEVTADGAIDGHRHVNAPWLVSVVREIRKTLDAARSASPVDRAGHQHGDQDCDPSEEAANEAERIGGIWEAIERYGTDDPGAPHDEAQRLRNIAAIVGQFEAALAEHGLYVRFDPPALRASPVDREAPNTAKSGVAAGPAEDQDRTHEQAQDAPTAVSKDRAGRVRGRLPLSELRQKPSTDAERVVAAWRTADRVAEPSLTGAAWKAVRSALQIARQGPESPEARFIDALRMFGLTVASPVDRAGLTEPALEAAVRAVVRRPMLAAYLEDFKAGRFDEDMTVRAIVGDLSSALRASPVDREDELDRLAALSDAATRGEWTWFDPTGPEGEHQPFIALTGDGVCIADLAGFGIVNGLADAAFIVAAVNYVRSRLAARSKDPSDAR